MAFKASFDLLGPEQHVGEDRNRVAPLDHAMDVAERLQQLGAFDGDLHVGPRSIRELQKRSGGQKVACGGGFRKGRAARNAGLSKQCQSCQASRQRPGVTRLRPSDGRSRRPVSLTPAAAA